MTHKTELGVDGQALRGPNDLVFDAHGGFYFTDPGKGLKRGLAAPPREPEAVEAWLLRLVEAVVAALPE